MEIWWVIVSGIVISAAGTAVGALLSEYLSRRAVHGTGGDTRVSYAEKIGKLVKRLQEASHDVDAIFVEIRQAAEEREKAVGELESKITELSAREQELTSRVDSLANIPLPAMEYFLRATAKSEERSVKRDTLFFVGGVVLTTIITVVLKVIFNI